MTIERFFNSPNVPGHSSENAVCPDCARPLIRRSGYTTIENNLAAGRCRLCHARIAGVWS